eukprot:13421029-Ditylum_brightwellii.AAC.1
MKFENINSTTKKKINDLNQKIDNSSANIKAMEEMVCKLDDHVEDSSKKNCDTRDTVGSFEEKLTNVESNIIKK